MHHSVITLKPLTGEVNVTDYLVMLQWHLSASWTWQNIVESKRTVISQSSGQGHFVIARRLVPRISKTACLLGCSQYAVVNTVPTKSSQKGAQWEQRLFHLVPSHRRVTVEQIGETVYAGCDTISSKHTMNCSLLCMWSCVATNQSALADLLSIVQRTWASKCTM